MSNLPSDWKIYLEEYTDEDKDGESQDTWSVIRSSSPSRSSVELEVSNNVLFYMNFDMVLIENQVSSKTGRVGGKEMERGEGSGGGECVTTMIRRSCRSIATEWRANFSRNFPRIATVSTPLYDIS